jgi:hypothetical protein
MNGRSTQGFRDVTTPELREHLGRYVKSSIIGNVKHLPQKVRAIIPRERVPGLEPIAVEGRERGSRGRTRLLHAEIPLFMRGPLFFIALNIPRCRRSIV